MYLEFRASQKYNGTRYEPGDIIFVKAEGFGHTVLFVRSLILMGRATVLKELPEGRNLKEFTPDIAGKKPAARAAAKAASKKPGAKKAAPKKAAPKKAAPKKEEPKKEEPKKDESKPKRRRGRGPRSLAKTSEE
jgi:hypothetical protein